MSEFESNTLKRENITANIVFCFVFAVGSFVFYKRTENVFWALTLFICAIVLLGFYSKILALEDEMENICEEPEEEFYEEEFVEEEEVVNEEERRSKFINNLPAFKREAKIKYNDTAKQLGKSIDCLSDGIIDVWLVDGRIVSMLKWKQIEKDLDDFEGEYADMIIDGMSGRNVEFEYGLERYKNMTKYGNDGVKHNLKEEMEAEAEEEEISEPVHEDSYEEEPEEEFYEEPKSENNNNLIAQIFEKLIS